MASINIRVDDELKARAYQELERLRKLPDCYQLWIQPVDATQLLHSE